MSEKIKVGAVSYLNTKPLTYGLQQLPFSDEITLSFEYPAILAEQLMDQSIDLGLVPVAAIPLIPNAHIVSDYCIGAMGKVNSVCLFSQVPMEAIEAVYLDYQSRTSVRLAQVLLAEYWQKEVVFLEAKDGYIDAIEGTTAGVIIGDRALKVLDQYPYVYDLSEYWLLHTGLPFVFAAWVANRPLSASFIAAFNAANSVGFQELETVIAQNAIDYYDLKTYYTRDIQYELTEQKRAALSLFLQKINPDFRLLNLSK